jgi:magnesium chelatase family protein
MLDRIDIHIEVPLVDYEELSSDRLGESSASIRER